MSDLKRSLYWYPLTLLLLTLLSGTWLRGQWAGLLPTLADSEFLLHAHSHVALLGWIFLVFVGLFWETFCSASKKTSVKWFLLGLFLLNLFMFQVFLRKGYALWSIISSMLFILITWVQAGAYLKKRKMISGFEQQLWDSSFFWLVFSSLGPVLLSMGAMMGPSWIQFWVSFYLYLQFLGWILPFSLILLHQYAKVSSIKASYALSLYNLALFPAFLAASKGYEINLDHFGWIPMLMVASSGLYLLWCHVQLLASNSWTIKSSILAIGISLVFLSIASLPGLKPLFSENRMAAISFVHLLLLGGFTVLGVEHIFNFFEKNTHLRATFLFRFLMIAGIWTMVGSLVFSSLIPVFKLSLAFRVHLISFWCGLAIIFSLAARWFRMLNRDSV